MENTYFDNEIENERKTYWKNSRKYLKPIEKKLGIKIKECVFVQNNEVFNKTLQILPVFEFFVLKGIIKVESSMIQTLVQVKENNIFKLKVHKCITLFLPDGSHIRFSPYKKGIEISRLYVNKENIGKGLGSSLMQLVLGLIRTSNNYIPEILVEITGAVGLGDNYIEIGIENQFRFYEKFGFLVKSSNKTSKKLIRPEGLDFTENFPKNFE